MNVGLANTIRETLRTQIIKKILELIEKRESEFDIINEELSKEDYEG